MWKLQCHHTDDVYKLVVKMNYETSEISFDDDKHVIVAHWLKVLLVGSIAPVIMIYKALWFNTFLSCYACRAVMTPIRWWILGRSILREAGNHRVKGPGVSDNPWEKVRPGSQA